MKDARDFPLNASAWFGSTRSMTRDERGDYIDLLALQWDNDGLPADLDALARSIGYKNAKKLSAVLIEKFPISSDGKRRNSRLEIERENQRSRMEKARDRIEKMNLARENKASARVSTREDKTPLQESLREHLTDALAEPPLTQYSSTPTQENNSPREVGADAPPTPPAKPSRRGTRLAPLPPGSMEDCQRFAVEIGAHWTDGTAFWDTMEDAGWTKNGGKTPVLDWRATMRKWVSMGYLPSKKSPWTVDFSEPPPWAAREAEQAGEPPDLDGDEIRAAMQALRDEQQLQEVGAQC